MIITVGSSSQRKILAIRKIVEQFFPPKDLIIRGCAVKSNVPDTPYDEETFRGAKNRAQGAKTIFSDSDFVVGLESGLVKRYGHLYEEAWAVVILKNGQEYYGYSSGLKVPDYVLRRMEESKRPHSEIMTILEQEHGKLPNDTWGSYSGGALAREVSLEESVRNAFIQVFSPEQSFYNK